MRAILLVTLALLAPAVIAAEPQGGPPTPWILQGPVLVTTDAPDTLPCVEPAQATIYTWVQSWSANFQLTVVGGCDPIATVFYGTGDIWSGFVLSEFVGTIPTTGTMSGFMDAPTVHMDLTQTLADGTHVHIVGDFVIIF